MTPDEAGEFPIKPGDRLGPYVVEEYLARGGMGVLLRGVDAHLDRPVAIKIVDPRFLQDTGFRARFVRECKILAKLRHPNIVSIYYFDEWEGTPFYAMELVEGTDLDELAEQPQRVSWRRAAGWLAQCCRALEAARAAGVIHRDLKPANILLDVRGSIRIVDFGLAKSLETSKQLTAAAMVVGTPHYMSPEQAKGRELDWRSDLYSLGATFFHVLAGRTPFDAPSAMEVVAAHISTPSPSVGLERGDLPRGLVELIDGLLAKQPEARGFDSYPEVAAAVEAILDAEPEGTTGKVATVQIPGTPEPEPYKAQERETAELDAAGDDTGRETVAREVVASRETVVAPSDPTQAAAPEAPPAPAPSATDETVAVTPEPMPAATVTGPAPSPEVACAWLEGAGRGPEGEAVDVAVVRTPQLTFGTSDRNGIHLPWSRKATEPKRVSRQGHGALVATREGFRLEVRQHRSGAVNACRLGQGELLGEGTHPVLPGDCVDLAGQYTLRLGGSSRGGLRVEVEVHEDATRAEARAGWYHVLFRDAVLMGSSSEAGLALDADAPAEAARLEADEEGFHLVPLAGEFTVAGRPVDGRRRVESGDLVEGPRVRFRFHRVGAPEELWS